VAHLDFKKTVEKGKKDRENRTRRKREIATKKEKMKRAVDPPQP